MARDERTTPDWRHPADYDDLLQMDRPAFAWELLRRNPRYRDETAGLALRVHDGVLAITPALANLASRWGLGFPRGGGPLGPIRPPVLAF